MVYINRRRFLNLASATSFAAGAGVLGGLTNMQAHAADVSGYKALVCIFLFGGMDHADTILPTDTSSYNQLAGSRSGLFNAYDVGDDPNSSRDINNLLALSPSNAASFGGRRFGLPRELAPLRDLFASGEAAIVGNVGPLIEPASRSQIDARSVALPPRLFSHNDQQSTWQSFGVEGTRTGWGGRFADAVIAADPSANPIFTTISTRANAVFLSGDTARAFRASPRGAPSINAVEQRFLIGSNRAFDDARERLAAYYGNTDIETDNLFVRDFAAANARGINVSALFRNASDSQLALSTEFPDNDFGNQLHTVAETISLRGVLNVNRQVFLVAEGGFDTHSGQSNNLPQLHAELAGAVAAFRNAMIELGVWQDVAVFTASDFGRTLVDNGDGTDHGWGGHHFVVGGSVNGGRIYGDIPSAEGGSEQYTPFGARLIPSVAVEQYAATLGRWFGLDATELAAALPNLGNFGNDDLGFMAPSSA